MESHTELGMSEDSVVTGIIGPESKLFHRPGLCRMIFYKIFILKILGRNKKRIVLYIFFLFIH